MNWFTKQKIELQRWNMRRKFNRDKNHDEKRKLKAIARAERSSKKSKVRLWVLRISPGRFVIRTKGEVKSILRDFGLKTDVNMYQTGETIVHITKKIHEI